uniref:Uncharacterized protein n=1 Tax=Romanomermis culicivorax TaxID=13658 RepID=A0A915HYX4_ROMCU
MCSKNVHKTIDGQNLRQKNVQKPRGINDGAQNFVQVEWSIIAQDTVHAGGMWEMCHVLKKNSLAVVQIT